MKHSWKIFTLILLSTSMLFAQGSGVDSLRLRSAAGGSVWLLLPQSSTQQYRLLLPPSLGTSTNQLMWINGATGQIALLPPGTTGQVLQIGAGSLNWVDPSSIIANTAWGLTGNSGTNPATNFLGTTDNQPLVIRTNNTERLRVTPTGRVGIGTTAPSTLLHLSGNNSPSSASILFDNTSYGFIAFRSNAEDFNYMVFYTPRYSSTGPYTRDNAPWEFGLWTANTLSDADRFYFGRSGVSGNDLVINRHGNVGISVAAPSHRLHVVATSDPLRLEGLQTDNTLDQVLVANASGVVKRRSASSLASSTAWSLTGNSGTNPSSNFLGTTDNQALAIRTNNAERIRINADGNIGIGTTAPAAPVDIQNFGNTALFSIGGGGTAYSLLNLRASNGSNNRSVISVGGNATQPILTFGAGYEGQYGTSFEIRTDIMGAGAAGAGFANLGQALVIKRQSIDGTTSSVASMVTTPGILAFATGYTVPGGAPWSSTRLLITPTGNIGIGTTIPSQRLHVVASSDPLRLEGLQTDNTLDQVLVANASGVVKLRSASSLAASTAWSLTGNSGTNPATNFLGTTDNQPLVIRTNNTERLRVTPTGRVGIGTTAPSTLLHLSGNNSPNSASILFDNTSYGFITFRSNAEDFNFMSFYTPRYSSTGPYTRDNAPWEFGLWTANTLSDADRFYFGRSGVSSNDLVINRHGNVGISVAAPSHRLHVVATSDPLRLEGLQTDNTLDQVLVANASGVVKLRSASSLAASTAWGLTGNSGTNPATNFLGTTDNQPLVIRTNNSERIRVTTQGFVGINTSTPYGRLDVDDIARQSPIAYPIGGGGNAHQVLTLRLGLNSRPIIGIPVSSDPSQLSVAFGAGYEGQYGSSFEVRTDVMGAGSSGYGVLGQALVIKRMSQDGTLGSIATMLTAPHDLGIVAGGYSPPGGAAWSLSRLVIKSNGDIGIGTTTPSHRLHVVATSDPIRLEGLQTDNTLDQVLVANASGVVKRRSASSLASSTAWSLTGNSGTNPATNFLGTTDNQPLVIRTNNTERLRISESGNVGIGTTAPTSRLVVASAGVGDNRIIIDPEYASLRSNIRFRLSGWGPPQRLWGVGADWDVGNFSVMYEGISSDNFSNPSRYLTITPTGNVGISTTSPSHRLHVVATSDPLRLEGLQTDNSLDQVLVANASGVVKLRSASTLASSTAWSLTGNSGTNPATNFLGTTDNQPLVIRTNNTERLRVATNGMTGIGTSNPWSILHIHGGNWNGFTLTTSEYNNIGTIKYDPLGTYVSGKRFLIISDETDNTQGVNGGIMFRVNDGPHDGHTTPAMVIRESRNIGIGTTGPQSKLQVVGAGGIGRSVMIDNREVKFRGDGVAHISIFGPDAGRSRLSISRSSSNFAPGTEDAELMVIESGGNVGIGTTTPAARLHVAGGDVQAEGHILIRNTDNTAREMRLYEPSGSGSEYTAFRAQAQGSNITYTLPASLTPTTTVAGGVLQTDASGNLSWLDPSTLGGSSGWQLAGNTITSAWNGTSGSFLGTINTQPLVIATTNTTTPQAIQFWAGNQQVLRLNPAGTTAPAWSIQRDVGGNTRGLYAVDLQVVRTSATQVASGSHSVIGGGRNNTASNQTATVCGGENNTASGNDATVGGGDSNTASGDDATVCGGENNTASGSFSTVCGGEDNTASGSYSTIAGGYKLSVGARSFGFSGQTSSTQTNLSANSNIAVFVDVDMWLYNVRNQASQLRLYEPSASGTNYSAFRAQAQGSNITYTLPASLTPTTTVAGGVLQTDASGNLSWLDPSTLGGSSGWQLAGNTITSAWNGTSGSFLGTTNTQPLVIATTNTATPQQIQFWAGNQQVLRLNPAGTTAPAWSIQRDVGGNTRGLYAVDLQVARALATQVASGNYSVIAGGVNNTASGQYSVVAGGHTNTANYLSVVAGGQGNSANSDNGVIGGGGNNTISNQYGVIGGGLQNTVSGYISTIAGGQFNSASNQYSAIGGGYQNTASGQYSVVAGGQNNTASSQHSVVTGGLQNVANSPISTVAGGQSNQATGIGSTIAGGQSNQASGIMSAIAGGANNIVNGDYSAIPGGYNLRIGTRSFGFSGQTSSSPTNLSSVSNIAAFVDVDMWLYNVRNQASQLRLYEPSGAGTNYTAFRAQAQAADIIYTLPPTLTPTTSVANALLQTDGSGNLSWVDPSSVVSSISWSLTGNSGTNPTNNFLGTTDNQPVVIRTNNQERMRISEDGNVKIVGSQYPKLHIETNSTGSTPGDSRLEFLGNRASGNAALGYIRAFNKSYSGTDDVVRISMNRDNADDAGMLQLMTKPTGGTLTTRVTINSDGNVIIGDQGTIPLSTYNTGNEPSFIVAGENRDVVLASFSSSDAAAKADIEFFRSRGTPSSPANIANNDLLGQIGFGMYHGGNMRRRQAVISAAVDGNPGNNDYPTRLEFYTTPDGSANEQLRLVIKNNGNVGIGLSNPTYQLQLSTDQAAKTSTNTWIVASDARLKTVIGHYTKGLRELLQLNPVLYRYRNTAEYQFDKSVLEQTNIGFVAQHVQQIFPEAITVDKHGYLGLNIHPILIAYLNAFKELDSRMTTLEGSLSHSHNQTTTSNQNSDRTDLYQRIEQLERQIERLERTIQHLMNEKQPMKNPEPWLGDNIPNPHEGTTTIPYYIPQGITSAILRLSNLRGDILLEVSLPSRGQPSQITISITNYPSGSYDYSLILDGQIVSTKRMQLIK